ncbi:MAG: hypothetical protein K2M94_05980 [Paramuribaculum sp.]|nr:hypothetical protein [Paramuribaculum sp.]
MAKSKQVKEKPQPQAKIQAEVKAAVGVTPQSVYRPLPRFNSGCKNC